MKGYIVFQFNNIGTIDENLELLIDKYNFDVYDEETFKNIELHKDDIVFECKPIKLKKIKTIVEKEIYVIDTKEKKCI